MKQCYTSISLTLDKNLRSGSTKGDNHFMLISLPNTDFKLAHLLLRCHFGSSCFSDSICVSSEHMADICVQNMTKVNMPNRSDSKPSIINSTKLAAGEKLEHWDQSFSMQRNMWTRIRMAAWNDIKNMYRVKRTKYFWFSSPTQLFTLLFKVK